MADKGIRVIPSVNWGNEDTFNFCFDGIPKCSIVAVSTYMVSEHNNNSDQKEFFLKGYNEMLKKIEPRKIICYNELFSEMQGDIIHTDYDLSGCKYLKGRLDRLQSGDGNGIIIYKTMIQPDDFSASLWKGSGSAYSSKWKPKKEDDERFLGKPVEIKKPLIKTESAY